MKDRDIYTLAFELGMKDCSLGIAHGNKFSDNYTQQAYDDGYGYAYEMEQIVTARFEQSFGEIFK